MCVCVWRETLTLKERKMTNKNEEIVILKLDYATP